METQLKAVETALSILRECHRPQRLVLVKRSVSHSYLSAATGSRREADQAGAKPENKPVRIETIMLTRTRPSENWIGKEGNAWPMPVHITYANPNPMNPPSRHSEVDSIRN